MGACLSTAVPAQQTAPLPGPVAPATAATPRFDILEFLVAGDTLLGAVAIERAVYPFLGPGREIADAEAARKALEAAYHGAGYLSVSVVLPAQQVDSTRGEVLLQVVPATVGRLRVTGAEFHLPSRVEAGLPSLAPGNVPDFNQMQRELAALSSQAPDRELTPILAAGVRPATLDVEIKVQDSLPLHGALELNNKQSLDTVAGRVEATLSYDNLFQRAHAIGLTWFYAPERPGDANIQSLSYAFPLGGSGDRATLLFTHSDSNTLTPVGGSTVSRGDTLRLRWRDELPSRSVAGFDVTQALSWGLIARASRDRGVSSTGAASAAPTLRYSTVSVGYDIAWQPADARSRDGSSSLSAELLTSLLGLDQRDVNCYGVVQDAFSCKRTDASARFQLLSLSATHRRPLGAFGLLLRLQAQVTDTPLVASEQIVFGGRDSVRGYFEGEQAGDLGAALRVELSTPTWPIGAGIAASGLVFHDAAVLRRLYASADESANPRLRSAGVGLHLDGPAGTQLRLGWAHVFATTRRGASGGWRPVSGPGSGNDNQWYLSVRQPF